MIVADSSAWVALFRGSADPVVSNLERMLKDRPKEIAVTEVIAMELLAGARTDENLRELRSTLLAQPLLTLEGLADYERAAAIYRTCRRAGETIRTMTDCLIAVPAIRAGAAVLHKDRDFDVIARHTDLSVYRLPKRSR